MKNVACKRRSQIAQDFTSNTDECLRRQRTPCEEGRVVGAVDVFILRRLIVQLRIVEWQVYRSGDYIRQSVIERWQALTGVFETRRCNEEQQQTLLHEVLHTMRTQWDKITRNKQQTANSEQQAANTDEGGKQPGGEQRELGWTSSTATCHRTVEC